MKFVCALQVYLKHNKNNKHYVKTTRVFARLSSVFCVCMYGSEKFFKKVVIYIYIYIYIYQRIVFQKNCNIYIYIYTHTHINTHT